MAAYSDGQYKVELTDNGYVKLSNGSKQIKTISPNQITPVSSFIAGKLKELGKNPDDYFECDGYPIRKQAQYVVEEAIQLRKSTEAKKANDKKTELQDAIKNGIAFRVAEIAEQYGGSLSWARWLENNEKERYAEWCRNILMCGFAAAENIKVETVTIKTILKDRQNDGMFSGCTNQTWIITQDEWDAILKLDVELKEQQRQRQIKYEQAEAKDLQKKIDTGFCFSCESYCYGDCGHYSNDPMVKFRRDIDTARRESMYGITD